ncbi:hypothetical protein GCM10009527_082540 [Actinomadura nitritigenes]|uniref:Uncharacterized protein n=1 Tax=Actinomadura nitritigenes TaxID=134602 RepID=A0ABS3QTD5_9ACTN|nr:hypothetical protein [Actinomadura nitritigenes]MBO2436659.1 hypothetical protein [Actinomadura nitritigenes]
MTLVMLLDDVPGLGVFRGVAAARVRAGFSPLSDEGLEFTARIGSTLAERPAVLALYPTWRPDAAARLLRFARASLGTRRLAIVPLDLPPLALSLVADQLAFLAPYVEPGTLATVAPRLAGLLVAGARVNSVTRLEHVRTGFGDHLASYLPGSEFLVTAAPRQGVRRAGPDTAPEAGDAPRPPVVVLAAEHGGDGGWVRDRLGPALGAVSVSMVADQPLGAEYWRAKRYVEFVAFSGDSGVLQAMLRQVVCEPCPWCGTAVGSPVCPFCGMVQPVRTPPPDSAPPPVEHPAAPGPSPARPLSAERPQPPPARLVTAPSETGFGVPESPSPSYANGVT